MFYIFLEVEVGLSRDVHILLEANFFDIICNVSTMILNAMPPTPRFYQGSGLVIKTKQKKEKKQQQQLKFPVQIYTR